MTRVVAPWWLHGVAVCRFAWFHFKGMETTYASYKYVDLLW